MTDVSKKGQEIKIQGNNLFERFQGKTIDLKCFKMFWNVLEHISTSEPAREVMKWNFSIGNIQNTIFNSQRSKLKCSKMF